jgi:hypothetical protein
MGIPALDLAMASYGGSYSDHAGTYLAQDDYVLNFILPAVAEGQRGSPDVAAGLDAPLWQPQYLHDRCRIPVAANLEMQAGARVSEACAAPNVS